MARRRLLVFTNEKCEVPFLDMFDAVLSWDPFSITKDDVLLLEGGTDINPAIYGDVAGEFCEPSDILRDSKECLMISKFKAAGASILGICRGAQLATCFAGGSLIQHVTGHGVWNGHDIVTDDGEVLKSSSVHHQMMYPFKLPKEEYQILARTPYNLSKLYLDGQGLDLFNGAPDNNTAQTWKNFVEPEIVWYPKIRALAIQGHPEYHPLKDPFVQHCRKLVERYLFT